MSADRELKTEGARNRRPDRLWLQQGIARKEEQDSDARSGVQGVNSSAWLEMMKVPGANIPLCHGMDLRSLRNEPLNGKEVENMCESIPPLAR